MTTAGPPGGLAPAKTAPAARPVPDVLAWELGDALAALSTLGRCIRLVPAGSPAAAGAARWRVVRQEEGASGELALVAVPEAPRRVEP